MGFSDGRIIGQEMAKIKSADSPAKNGGFLRDLSIRGEAGEGAESRENVKQNKGLR